ncbi:hypothetical protein Cgig2_026423 [Carnegiea gigantea]|uniref:Uncharacterized protein n=1 Tax=Carnegiea gigantea TaxID=171969 RepID=A0A9Q1GKM2_9CARY|nr:hypothetical protein Cgig2_026423 [Carnegiea gigantea]
MEERQEQILHRIAVIPDECNSEEETLKDPSQLPLIGTQISEHAVNPEKAPQISEGTDKAAEIYEINKAKQAVKRQQPKRMVTQVPFQCRPPYLKDYREARDRLTHQQLMLVDYAFLPPDELHPSMEKLFEYAHEEEDTKLWIIREAFETLGGIE